MTVEGNIFLINTILPSLHRVLAMYVPKQPKLEILSLQYKQVTHFTNPPFKYVLFLTPTSLLP